MAAPLHLARLAALVAIVCALAATASAQKPAESDPRVRAAESIKDGNTAVAEAELEAVLKAAPADADALSLLGVVRAIQGRPADAEQLFRRAIAANPRHLSAHINLGELYITTERTKEALDVMLVAQRLAPDRPDITIKVAGLLEELGEFARALTVLERVPRAAVDGEYVRLRIIALAQTGKMVEARALAREVAPSSPEQQAPFAMMLAGAGLRAEALAILEAARAKEPRSFSVLYALGVVSLAEKRLDVAEDALAAALEVRPDDVSVLRALARVAVAEGNLEKALSFLLHARKVAPDSPGVLYDLGATAIRMGLILDAMPIFERLHSQSPREPAYLYALAVAKLAKGERPESVRLMREYVELRSNDAAGFRLLGAALQSVSQLAEARDALERSLALAPDPETEYLLASVLYDEGNRAAAMEAARHVLRDRPDYAAAHALLGAAYRDDGKIEEARAELERAVALDEHDLRAHYQLGLVYAKVGEKEKAKTMLDRAEVLRGEQRKRETVVFKLVDPPPE